MEGHGIGRFGDAWTVRRRWIRIKRGFHKKEVVVWRGFTLQESGMKNT